MPALLPRATPINDTAHLRILEAYIETLKAENESLKRQLADAEKRAARETAKSAASIAEFSAITRRLTARTVGRAQPTRQSGDSFLLEGPKPRARSLPLSASLTAK